MFIMYVLIYLVIFYVMFSVVIMVTNTIFHVYPADLLSVTHTLPTC